MVPVHCPGTVGQNQVEFVKPLQLRLYWRIRVELGSHPNFGLEDVEELHTGMSGHRLKRQINHFVSTILGLNIDSSFGHWPFKIQFRFDKRKLFQRVFSRDIFG